MNLPKRKPTRLKEYDYSTPGAYFITICSHNRKCIFSEIKNNDFNLNDNKLNKCGICVKQVIEKIPDRFNICIPNYVIMPNHIHFIAIINENSEKRAIRESPLHHNRSLIDKLVGFLKMNVSKKINSSYKASVWQRSYHDHIIRNENEYKKISEYIDTNVLRWEYDCFFTSD